MGERLIYHVCERAAWEAVQSAGRYLGSAQDRRDGFIHFSTVAQVEASAAKHHAGRAALVLLAVDPGALGDALRWEPSRGGDLFPHLYGPLPLAAVRWAEELAVGPDGRHLFPRLDRA